MKIRLRLTLFGGFVIAVAMIVFSLLLAALARGTAPEEQERNLGELADSALATIQDADASRLTPDDPAAVIDPALSTEPFIVIAAIDGTLLYTAGVVNGDPPPIPAQLLLDAENTGSSAVVYEAAPGIELRMQARYWERFDAGRSGVVIAAQTTDVLDEQFAALVAVLWIAGVVTLIAAIAASWVVSGRALRPLRELATTTDDIGETGNLDRRLPAVKAADEVGRLTESFNSMLDRLAESQGKLEDSLESQRRFVADASHELRSPLTTIRSNAGFLIEQRSADPTDRDEAIADIATEANRMARLVDDLLELARADAGHRLFRRPVDLRRAIDGAVRRARRTGHDIAVTVSGDPIVTGDSDAIERLFWILVDNATKHGAPPYAVEASPSPGAIEIVVADSGPGIPPADLPRIFDRFHRADAARSPQGAGLGLAIAREITEGHGGSIVAENLPEGGAQFTVRLPLAETAAGPPPAREPASPQEPRRRWWRLRRRRR